MHRLVSRLLGYGVFLFPLLVAASVAGCTGSPIGDPCIPENIPQEDRDGDGFADGFDSAEVYIETSSVQCRTRTCMVYALDGNPEKVTGSESCPSGDPTCVTPVALEAQVFCSCRCSLGPGASANTPLCNCGDGFTCVDDLVTTGGDGVVGGYCVPCIRPQDDREGLAGVYDNCPTPGS